MNRLEDYKEIAKIISNASIGDAKMKELIREMIIDSLIDAYLDKSDEFDYEMIDYLKSKKSN